MFDPLTNAVRRDVADIRLADRVFAPHYAAPMPRRVAVEASLLGSTEQEAPILAMLRPGEIFEVLDLAGGNAWGIAVAHNLVGYVDAGALELAQ
ncbi:SH3 domain-containing protein [Sphingomonas oligophenolica]|uniref:SH3 domain-containing protein n=1 Tax=Sphingomonas oligophenolica TaxID=301154 RepID=UPI0031DC6C20